MKEKPDFLWADQFGNFIYAGTLAALKEKTGHSRHAKTTPIYRETASGRARVGYIVGERWFNKFAAVEEILP